MPSVSYKRKEIRDLIQQYELIEDCLKGETAVKGRKERYLPRPAPEDASPENMARYHAYLTRAVFYNVTKRTLAGLIGQIYLRDPVVEVPPLLDTVHWDATGGGITLEQLSKRACRWTLAFGRMGIFVDYPRTEGKPATRADIEAGNIRPTLHVYHGKNIINWRTIKIGARELLSLVVVEREYIEDDDGFMQTKKKEWLVLRLDENRNYIQEIWRDETSATERITPIDANGNPLKEIPFIFVGAENNDAEADDPPLYDLASLNIGHYRNSADYEESAYIAGQPTPYFSGLTEEWVKNVFKGVVALGSRNAVPLPQGANAGLLQAEANSMPFEAMQHKERQMVALGAKLAEQRSVQRTAREADQEHSTDLSTLSSVAQNVGSAIAWALECCARFVGVSDSGIQFELNNEFDLSKLTPEERRQLISEWQAGAITFEEMRENMRKSGIATLDDEEAREKIQEELETTAPPIDDEGENDGET